MNPSDFETRARGAARAEAFIKTIEIDFNDTGPIALKHQAKGAIFESFQKGAKWARRETISEVLNLLRHKDSTTCLMYGDDWADFIERQMKDKE